MFSQNHTQALVRKKTCQFIASHVLDTDGPHEFWYMVIHYLNYGWPSPTWIWPENVFAFCVREKSRHLTSGRLILKEFRNKYSCIHWIYFHHSKWSIDSISRHITTIKTTPRTPCRRHHCITVSNVRSYRDSSEWWGFSTHFSFSQKKKNSNKSMRWNTKTYPTNMICCILHEKMRRRFSPFIEWVKRRPSRTGLAK